MRPAPEILEYYQDWQTKYCNLESDYRRNRLHFINENNCDQSSNEPGNSLQECKEAAERLKGSFQAWLNCDEFRPIERELLTDLSQSDEIRVILQTEDEQLRKLPWEDWNVLQRFPDAELGISPLTARMTVRAPRQVSNSEKVRILAILGNSEGINTQEDRNVLERLPDAELCFLVEPTHKEFKRLWEDHWDILFFAGHSCSQDGEKGYIYINQTSEGKLEIGELEETLRTAVTNGLKLAIFNSCDGLGLARQLEKIHIPQVIVMREPVPDKFAQEFLSYFLENFSSGMSLFAAVRDTRRKLRGMLKVDEQFPGASWLPVICQNPAAKNFVWPSPPALLKQKMIHTIPSSPHHLMTPSTNNGQSPKRKSWWHSFAKQLRQPSQIVIFSGLVGITIAVTTIWHPVQSPHPVLAENSKPESFAEVLNVPLGLYSYGGSTTWAPIRGQIDRGIETVWPQFKLRYTDSMTDAPGSGTGIKMLLNNQLAFAQSSRSIKDEEYQQAKARGYTLKEVPVGFDGIAIAVNPKLNIPGLTIDQLNDIYTGKLTNWKQVGGPNLAIIPYSRRPEDSGTIEFFVEKVLSHENFGNNVQFIPTTTQALRKVAVNPGGIYYASAPEVVGQCTVKPLPLGHKANEWVPPYQEPSDCQRQRNQVNAKAFQNGKYPITRQLFVIIKQNGRIEQQAGEAYANLLLTAQGQELIAQAGFVSLH